MPDVDHGGWPDEMIAGLAEAALRQGLVKLTPEEEAKERGAIEERLLAAEARPSSEAEALLEEKVAALLARRTER